MIRLATIGTSAITERFADAVAYTDGIRIDVAYSRDAGRAREFAGRLGIPESSDDLDGVLRAGRIDAIYVGSPNGVHAAQARAAIDAGVHVFLEKPATPTATEFEELLALACARGVIVFEGMRNAYDPGMDAVLRLLPQIGTVRSVSFGQSQYSTRYDLVRSGQTPNIFDPGLAGGALYDLGVYPLSATVVLFGAPAAVTGGSVRIATGVDGAGAAVLTYPEHVVQIGYSKIGVSHRANEIQGEEGTIEIDEITAPRELTVTRRDGTREEHRIDAATNNMVYEVARFCELVDGADPTPDQARTLTVLQIVDALREAGG